MDLWGKSMLSTQRAAAMKPATRALVAFIAGELILRRGFTKIYDYSNGQSYSYRTRITEYDVEVEDPVRNTTLMAGGAFGKHFSLTHNAEQALVEINIAGKNFDGEHAKGPHFKGWVKDKLVTLKEGSDQFVFGLMN
jgi:hypothetical protein